MMRHSGTHLVKPVLKNTIGTSKGGKGPTLLALPTEGEIIVCTRDPRNRVISSFRYKQYRITGRPDPRDDVDALLAEYIESKQILPFMHEWADRWMNLPHAHYLKFEDFLHEKTVIRTVLGAASYAGKEVDEDTIRSVWRRFYGNSPTFSGQHSRHQNWFGDKARAAWKEGNGKLLAKKMGYR